MNVICDMPRILVIDDDRVQSTILSAMLGNDYEVIVENDARRGVDRAIEIQPDLILLDVMMPEIDGLELCEKFKNHKELQQIPIVFMSGLDEYHEQGFEIGGEDFIAKNTSAGVIRARVDRALQQSTYVQFLERSIELSRSADAIKGA